MRTLFTLPIVVILIASSGCTSISNYAFNRYHDVLDIPTLSIGMPIGGVKARVGPLHCGLFAGHDFAGLRGGHLGLRWGVWDGVYSIEFDHFPVTLEDDDEVRFGADAFGAPGISQDRGKAYVVGYDVPFISYKQKDDDKLCPAYYFSQIEVAAGLGIYVRVGLNPGEFLDFILGISGIDIYNDDLSINYDAQIDHSEVDVQDPYSKILPKGTGERDQIYGIRNLFFKEPATLATA